MSGTEGENTSLTSTTNTRHDESHDPRREIDDASGRANNIPPRSHPRPRAIVAVPLQNLRVHEHSAASSSHGVSFVAAKAGGLIAQQRHHHHQMSYFVVVVVVVVVVLVIVVVVVVAAVNTLSQGGQTPKGS